MTDTHNDTDNTVTAAVTIETRANIHPCPTGALPIENGIENLSLVPSWSPTDTGALRRDTESGLGSSHSGHSNDSPTSGGSQWDTPRREHEDDRQPSVTEREFMDDFNNMAPADRSVNDQTDGMQQPKGGLLKLAVRRYMGKDRLFHLVQTLLTSEREEKRATEEYIASLSSARIVTGHLVPTGDRDVSLGRPQRIKKRRRETLADRIQNQRKSIGLGFYQKDNDGDLSCVTLSDGITGSIPVDKYNGQSDRRVISEHGEHKGTSSETTIDQHWEKHTSVGSDISDHRNDQNYHHRVTFDIDEARDTDCENVANSTIHFTQNEGENQCVSPEAAHHIKNTELHRSKTKSAGDVEKNVALEELRLHKDRDILDTLVLKSVMENTSLNLVPTLGRRLKELKVQVNTRKRCDKGNQCNGNVQLDTDAQLENVVKIEVEPGTDSDDDSTNTDNGDRCHDDESGVVGMNDDTETPTTHGNNGNKCTSDPDIDGHTGYYGANRHVPSNHCRLSSNLQQPCLETINEAEQSTESFQSLHFFCDSRHTSHKDTGDTIRRNCTELPVIRKNVTANESDSQYFSNANPNNGRIQLNLIEIYETNTCLQKVKKHVSNYKPKEIKQSSPVTVVQLPIRKQRWSKVPLPPKQMVSRCTQTPKSNLPDVHVPQNCDKVTCNLLDQYKRYQSTKDYLRHSKPDYTLLGRLETERDYRTKVTSSPSACEEQIVETAGCHADVSSVRRVAANSDLIRALDLKQRHMRSDKVQRLYRSIRREARNRGCYSARSAYN